MGAYVEPLKALNKPSWRDTANIVKNHVSAALAVGQLDRLRRDMGTGDPPIIADGVRRLLDAARRVTDSVKGRSLDRHHTGDFSRPVSIATINQRNRAFHARNSAAPTLDSSGRMIYPRSSSDAAPGARSTAFRDAMHAANTATTPREHIAALNAASKAFWHRGEPPTVTGDALRRLPAPTTVGEINQRNRAYWAGRS
jgi:hypothetical protein